MPPTFIMEDIYDMMGGRDSGVMRVFDVVLVLALLVGLIRILRWWLIKCKYMRMQCCRQRFQSETRTFDSYGVEGKTWAVVSGGSDGIGLAMCKKLAKEGFNICIIARNEEKMQNCLRDITDVYPNIETKYIVADFGKLSKAADYREKIGDLLK